MTSEPFSSSSSWMADLRDKINLSFSTDDLHGLAMDFDLDYDDLDGNKQRRVVELIESVVRRERIVTFIERCHELKPKGNFHLLLEAARQEAQSFQLEYESASPATDLSELLDYAMRLLELQARQKDDRIYSEEHTRQTPFTKQVQSETTKADFGSAMRRNETVARSSKTPDEFNPTRSQTRADENFHEKGIGRSTVIDRMYQDVARLEANLDTLGKMESILEDVRERIGYLLEGIREEKFELKNKVEDQHQMIQTEMMKVAKDSNQFQEGSKIKSAVSKSGMTNRPGHATLNRGWKREEHPYN